MGVQQNKQRGYEFEHEIIRGLELNKKMKPFIYKIPDVKTMGYMMTWKVPADIMFSYKNQIYTIEAKQTKLSRIPWANFKPHQITWVMENEKACFVINFNDRKKINKTFIVHREELKELLSEFKTSVPLSEFKHEIERKTARFHPDKLGAFIDFGEIKW